MGREKHQRIFKLSHMPAYRQNNDTKILCLKTLAVIFFFASFSFVASFALAKSDDDKTLQFFVIGDWGTPGSKGQRAVARQMNALASTRSIDFIASTGDNIYGRGVTGVDDPLWKRVFEDVYSLPALKDIPWYISLGNHDHLGDIYAQIQYGKSHPNWILPGSFHQVELTLAENKSVQLLFLDTSIHVEQYRRDPANYKNIFHTSREDHLAWLEEKLAGSNSEWRLVFAHHPVYSAGAHGDTEELKPVLPEIFEKNKVQAFFAGHDHHLEHNKPEGKTHYFISGAGSRTRPVKHKPDTEFALQSLGFAYVVLDEDCMQVFFIDEEGREIYKSTVAKNEMSKCKMD